MNIQERFLLPGLKCILAGCISPMHYQRSFQLILALSSNFKKQVIRVCGTWSEWTSNGGLRDSIRAMLHKKCSTFGMCTSPGVITVALLKSCGFSSLLVSSIALAIAFCIIYFVSFTYPRVSGFFVTLLSTLHCLNCFYPQYAYITL